MASFLRCNSCEFMGFKSQMVCHIIAKHRSAEEAPFHCKVCGYKGSSSDQMAQHVSNYPPHLKKWNKLDQMRMQALMIEGFVAENPDAKDPVEGVDFRNTLQSTVVEKQKSPQKKRKRRNLQTSPSSVSSSSSEEDMSVSVVLDQPTTQSVPVVGTSTSVAVEASQKPIVQATTPSVIQTASSAGAEKPKNMESYVTRKPTRPILPSPPPSLSAHLRKEINALIMGLEQMKFRVIGQKKELDQELANLDAMKHRANGLKKEIVLLK